MKGLLTLHHCLPYLILIFIVGTSGMGCAPMSDYHPNERAVQTLGMPEAWQRLRLVMLRAVNPQIQVVQLTEDGIVYSGTRMLPMFVQAPASRLMAFTNISGVDVYANHTVYVKGAAGQATDIFALASDEDAKAFADLLMSFRSQYLRDKTSFQALPPPR